MWGRALLPELHHVSKKIISPYALLASILELHHPQDNMLK